MKTYPLYLTALLLCTFVHLSLQTTYPVPQAVIDAMAAPDQRYHHSFFHNVRMDFLSLNQTQQRQLMNLGWEPPRPAYAYALDGTQVTIDGDAGEDFLYMHRQMIDNVNSIAQAAGSLWKVTGWTYCPAPGDPTWPVAPGFPMTDQTDFSTLINNTKTDDYYWNTIAPEEDWIDDSDNLRTLTLGQLGVRLEFGLHTWFHLRFSAYNPIGYRVQDSNYPTAQVDDMWNVVEYDWLADFYSAHVNVIFWQIHGWIEKKISLWMAANGQTTIEWNGTWQGGPLSVLDDLFAVASGVPVTASDATDSSDYTDSSDSSENGTIDPAVVDQIVALLLGGGN